MDAPASQRFLDYIKLAEHIHHATANSQGLWPALTVDLKALETEFAPFFVKESAAILENWPSTPPMTSEEFGSIVCIILTMVNGVSAESHDFIKDEPCRNLTSQPKYRGADIVREAINNAIALPGQGERMECVCWSTTQLLTNIEYGKANSDQNEFVFWPLISQLRPGFVSTIINDPIFESKAWEALLKTYTFMNEGGEQISNVPINPPLPTISAGLLKGTDVFIDKPEATGENLVEATYKFLRGQLEYLEKKNSGLFLRLPSLKTDKYKQAPLILRYRALVMLLSVMGSSCNISRPEVMNAFIAITNLIQLETIANTKEGKYLQQFKKTVFIPLVWMALQLLEQSGPLDWSPLDLAGWANSTSLKSAAIALAVSPFMMLKILTGNKPPSLKDWKEAEGYPKLSLHEDNAMAFLVSAHKEQEERIRNKKMARDSTTPPAPEEPTRANSDTSEITDTDISTNSNQSQAGKRWADLFDDVEAKAKNLVKEDVTKTRTIFYPHIYAMMKEQKRMAEQLTKLTNLFDEQNKVIVSQSIMLQEINTKLTVAEGHNSSSLTTPGISLDNYDKKMATVKQEIQDRKSKQIASDNDLAKELQEGQESTKVDKKVGFRTPFKVQELTSKELSALFSGKK